MGDLNQILAQNIRKRRLDLGVSQEGLAELCGLHRTYISAVELGHRNVTLKTLTRIAVALRTSPVSLLQDMD